MTIITKYNIGDTVKIKEYRSAHCGIVAAEIKRFTVSKDGHGNTNIRYTLSYFDGCEHLLVDRWEEDLAAEQEEVSQWKQTPDM